MGNPFLDNFPELVTLDNRNCMDDDVAKTIVNASSRMLSRTGQRQLAKP